MGPPPDCRKPHSFGFIVAAVLMDLAVFAIIQGL